MILGRVVGTVVCSQQHPFFHGRKQLVVRYTVPGGAFDGEKYVIAVDIVGAGVGETVLVQDEGNSARQTLDCHADGPIRALIVGIVDDVHVP